MYRWKPGRSFPVAADVVGKTVDRIIKRQGVCPPASLVDAARADDSALHPLFEWRDDVASEKWRVHQARQVLNSLRVIVVKHADASQPPAFLSVRAEADTDDEDAEPQEEGYRSIKVVRRDPALRRAAVLREWAFLRGYFERVSWIDEFAPLWPAISQVEALLFGAQEPPAEQLSEAAD